MGVSSGAVFEYLLELSLNLSFAEFLAVFLAVFAVSAVALISWNWAFAVVAVVIPSLSLTVFVVAVAALFGGLTGVVAAGLPVAAGASEVHFPLTSFSFSSSSSSKCSVGFEFLLLAVTALFWHLRNIFLGEGY